MKRALLLAVVALLSASCASGPTPRDLIQLTYYRVTRKVLVFVPGPNGLVSCWVSEKNVQKGAAQCQAKAFVAAAKTKKEKQL